MMSVLEYANDIGKTSEDILKMCEKLNIKVSNLDDMLSEDDIVELDNTFEKEKEYSSAEQDDEIIKKIEEDDYYDEVVDTLIDKKDTIYSNEPSPVKKKKAKKKDIKD